MTAKIIDRVRKLLALAGNNPVQAEIEAALLMARKLMAEHGLSEGDVEAEIDRQEDVLSQRAWEEADRDRARVLVLNAVAGAHRCMVTTNAFGVATIHGRESDVAVATAVFDWAWQKVDYLAQITVKRARAAGKRERKPLSTNECNDMRYSYVLGFAHGLYAAYMKQSEANPAWGLVLSVPEEVRVRVQKMTGGRKSKAPTPRDTDAFNSGYAAGQRYVDESSHRERPTLAATPRKLVAHE